jgi:hypothetical protein
MLSMAVLMRRVPVGLFLIANGANPHLEDRTGRDSCDYAQINSVKGIPELLQCVRNQRVKWFNKEE